MTSDSSKSHQRKVATISEQISTWLQSGSSKKLRFRHGGTNSTRAEDPNLYEYIDTSNLDQVIEVNAQEGWAQVEPNVSMEKLFDATFKYGLIPQVVAEFPAITVGGAIQGASLESSSFKFGQLNDGCLEYEIIQGNGEVVICSPHKNADLFYGVSGSYGTLGVLTLVKIRLIQARPYIKVVYTPTKGVEETLVILQDKLQEKVDFLEGLVLAPNRGVVITGSLSEKGKPVKRFSRASDPWFHTHASSISNLPLTEFVPIKDYIFRYDRGAFWMGEYTFPMFKIFGIQMKSSRFHKFVWNHFLKTEVLYKALHYMKWSQRFLIQDIYMPWNNTKEFIEYISKTAPTYPLWLCPIKGTSTPQKLSPHYLGDSMLIDIGIWKRLSASEEENYFGLNREIETETRRLGGRKMLYAQAFYSKEDFWQIYDQWWYEELRSRYEATRAFPQVYDKVVVTKKYKYRQLRELRKFFTGIYKLSK